MSKRGENIWHRKDGRWEARYVKYYKENRAVYGYLYAGTYGEVKEKRQRLLSEKITVADGSDLLFSSLVSAFLKKKQFEVKQSTFAQYKSVIKKRILPFWNGKFPREIKKITVEQYIQELYQKGLSQKTVKDTINLLLEIFAYGESIEKIDKTPKISNVRTKKTREKAVLSEEEQIRFINYLTKAPDLSKIGVLLALTCGLRIGEVCGLQRNDILKEKIFVRRTIQRIPSSHDEKATSILIDSPKTENSEREIPLPLAFSAWLETRYKDLPNDTYLLTGTRKYIEPRNYYRKYQRYLQECGMPHYTFHMLRHTFATEAIKNGMDIKSLSEILGHSNVKITLDCYVHSSSEQKIKAMEKFFCSHPLQSRLQSKVKKAL